MLRWLQRRLRNNAIRSIGEDIDQTIVSLQGMDSEAVAMVVAVTAHIRNVFYHHYGMDLHDGDALHERLAEIEGILRRTAITIAKKEQSDLIGGFSVWILTYQALQKAELRLKGRQLWGQMRRGFPHVRMAAQALSDHSRISLVILGHDRIPLGMEPEVR